MAAITLEGELTEEGKKMWQNIMDYGTIINGNPLETPRKPRKVKISVEKIENDFYRLEIRRMIHNSKLVIQDCDRILQKCENIQDYISSDAKVAKTIHSNLINRLEKILKFSPAFEHEITLPDEVEKENKLFFDNTKRR